MMYLNLAIEKITSQQPKERTAVWTVGEQLKDILRHEPHLAEIVVQDLEREAMSIANCEKEIKKFVDKHKSGGFSCVIPAEADRIIREFYGLANAESIESAQSGKSVDLDLADFL